MTPGLLHLKTTRRYLKRIYCSTHSPLDIKIIRTATNKYHKFISFANRTYNSNLIFSSISNPILLWTAISSLRYRNRLRSLPSTKSLHSFPQLFATCFSNKVCNLHNNLISTISATPVQFPLTSIPSYFPTFASVFQNEISHLYLAMLKHLLRPRSYTYLTS